MTAGLATGSRGEGYRDLLNFFSEVKIALAAAVPAPPLDAQGGTWESCYVR